MMAFNSLVSDPSKPRKKRPAVGGRKTRHPGRSRERIQQESPQKPVGASGHPENRHLGRQTERITSKELANSVTPRTGGVGLVFSDNPKPSDQGTRKRSLARVHGKLGQNPNPPTALERARAHEQPTAPDDMRELVDEHPAAGATRLAIQMEQVARWWDDEGFNLLARMTGTLAAGLSRYRDGHGPALDVKELRKALHFFSRAVGERSDAEYRGWLPPVAKVDQPARARMLVRRTELAIKRTVGSISSRASWFTDRALDMASWLADEMFNILVGVLAREPQHMSLDVSALSKWIVDAGWRERLTAKSLAMKALKLNGWHEDKAKNFVRSGDYRPVEKK